MADDKTPALARIIRDSVADPPRNVLVVGCGDGVEAAILAQAFGATVTGIDMHE